ncbi:unnamed protein product, partial [marine sediment metagenome]
MRLPSLYILIFLVILTFAIAEQSSSSINWLSKSSADSLYMSLITCSDTEILVYNLATSSWICG